MLILILYWEINFSVRGNWYYNHSYRDQHLLLMQRRHGNTVGFSAILSELVTKFISEDCRLPLYFLNKAKCSAQLRVGTFLIVITMLCPSCLLHFLSCGPSEKRTQSMCSYFLSPQTRHWTAVRLEKLLLIINLHLIWTTELGMQWEKSIPIA